MGDRDGHLLSNDSGTVYFRGQIYPIKVVHYWPGRELDLDKYPEQVQQLVKEADRMGSSRLTIATVQLPITGRLLLGYALCRKGETVSKKCGRLLAKDRLFSALGIIGGVPSNWMK